MNTEKYFRKGVFNDTISSTILFVIAYLFVLYFSLSATAFISFTNSVAPTFEIDKINFDKATFANNFSWTEQENIFTIFSFSPLALIILGLLSFLLIYKTKLTTIRVFFFWVIFNCIIRFFGDFIYGHVFGLWGANLLSDFMYITNGKIFATLLLCSLAFICSVTFPLILKGFISTFFNPIINDPRQGTKINFILPSIFGTIILFLWFIPKINYAEILMSVNAVIATLTLSQFIINKTKHTFLKENSKENDEFNINLNVISLVGIIIILTIIKITLFNGILIKASDYRQDQLDTIFYTSVIIIVSLAILLFIAFLIYNSIKNKKRKAEILANMIVENEEQTMDPQLLKNTRYASQLTMQEKAEKAPKIMDE
ncbi:MAG: hypothetical protein LBM25_04795 [Bacteroidales bacterium]|nr:hypothetical protein [Bacteroidales bacterium]